MHNKAELLIEFLILALLVTACVAMRSKSHATVEPYESIPRTITITPTTIEWYDDCMEDEPCWDCRTMGNRICGTEGK